MRKFDPSKYLSVTKAALYRHGTPVDDHNLQSLFNRNETDRNAPSNGLIVDRLFACARQCVENLIDVFFNMSGLMLPRPFATLIK